MATIPIYPQEQNFSTPLMPTTTPNFGLMTEGMQSAGKSLQQAMMRRKQAAQGQALAQAAAGGPIMPGGGGGMGGAQTPPASSPTPEASPPSPMMNGGPAPTGPVPTPDGSNLSGMAPPPTVSGNMGYPAAGIPSQGGNMSYPALGIPGQSALGFKSAGGNPGDILSAIENGIAKVESKGNYNAVGPDVRGDRALGKYQVMGANVPSWTSEALGYSETPQQFLHDPQAQEAVASTKMGEYLHKYGDPQDVASMWFSGKPASQSHGLSDGNMKADQYIAATVGNVGQSPNAPSSNAMEMAGRLPPDPSGSFSIPGGAQAPQGQGSPPAGNSGPSGAQSGMDPRVQQRLQAILEVATSPYADPQTKEMALQLYQQQMQFAMPHPMSWANIPGTNNERQLDWLGRPTGQILEGGPLKLGAGETLASPNGQGGYSNVGGADEWSTSTYTDLMGQQHLVKINKRTGQVVPAEGGAPNGPASASVTPGSMGSPMGGGSTTGPQPGNARGAPVSLQMPPQAPPNPTGAPLYNGAPPPFSGLNVPIWHQGGTPTGPIIPPPADQGGTMNLPTFNVTPQSPGAQPSQYPTQQGYEQNLDHALDIERTRLAPMGISGDAAETILGQARDVLLGKRPDPATFQGMAGAKPQDLAIERVVSDLTKGFDPSYNANRYQAMKTFNADNGPGSPGGMMQFGRTMMHHLNLAAQNSDAISGGQSNIPIIGPLINEFTQNPQQADKVAAYETAVKALGEEKTRFYQGSNGSQDERDLEKGLDQLNAASTPDQRRAALRTLGQLVRGKVNSLQSRWHDAVGGLPDYDILGQQGENDYKSVEASQVRGGAEDPRYAQARAAISKGAPRDKVSQRLKGMGLDPSKL